MSMAGQFISSHLYLLGTMLFLAAILVARKIPARWRISWLMFCLVPAIGLLLVAQHLYQLRREVERQSLAIFSRITPNAELCDTEIAALGVLATNSLAVREEVMRLAFANNDNAGGALPRLELLLHCVLQSDPTGEGREELWQKVVKPALRKNPPREVILLAAALTTIGGYGQSEAATVLPKLYPLFAGETNSEMRTLPLGVFAPLAEFASEDQVENAANFLLLEVLKEPNPVKFQVWFPEADPIPSRNLKDLCRVADHLSGPAARRFADKILPAMAAATNVSRTIALGKMMVAMKADLNATQMNLAVSSLNSRWLGDRDFVLQRGGLLASLAAAMTPEQASNCVVVVLAGIEAQPNQWWRERPTEPLKTLATRLDKEALLKLAGPMAANTPVVMETVRARISEEEAYDLMIKLEQNMLDTPDAKKRSAKVPGIQSLATCFSPEPAGTLADQLWHLYLRDQDGQRRNDEAYCLVALFPRMNDQQAANMAKLVVKQMQQPGSDLPVLIGILNPLLNRCEPATVKEAVACLIAFPNRRPAGRELNEFMLGAHMTPAQIKTMIEPLVAGLENVDNIGASLSYVKPLAPLTGQLSTDQMKRVADSMVFLYTQRPEGRGSEQFFPRLDMLVTNVSFNPKQSKRIQDIVLPEALDSRSYLPSPYANTVGFLSRGMDSAGAGETGQLILSAMVRALTLKVGGPFRSYGQVLSTGSMMQNGTQCLQAMARSLQPEQSERLAGQLMQMATYYGNHPGFFVLLDAANPPAPAGWQLPWEFIEHQEQRHDNYVLGAWSQSVEAMISRMNKVDAQNIADQVATRLAQQAGLGPMAFDEPTAKLLQYASEPVLKEILTKPCAVGGLRQIVLNAWELKTGKPFKDEIWKFSTSTGNSNSG
jgi:hypothetical protein